MFILTKKSESKYSYDQLIFYFVIFKLFEN